MYIQQGISLHTLSTYNLCLSFMNLCEVGWEGRSRNCIYSMEMEVGLNEWSWVGEGRCTARKGTCSRLSASASMRFQGGLGRLWHFMSTCELQALEWGLWEASAHEVLLSRLLWRGGQSCCGVVFLLGVGGPLAPGLCPNHGLDSLRGDQEDSRIQKVNHVEH